MSEMSNLLFALHITKAGGDWGEMKWSSKTNRIKTSDQKRTQRKEGGGLCCVVFKAACLQNRNKTASKKHNLPFCVRCLPWVQRDPVVIGS